MPILGKSTENKFTLPSFKGTKDPAWVILDLNLSVGDAFGGLEKESDSEKVLHVLVSAIKDWNFTDKDGKKSQISIENVKKIPARDFIFLASKLNLGEVKLETAKKKT